MIVAVKTTVCPGWTLAGLAVAELIVMVWAAGRRGKRDQSQQHGKDNAFDKAGDVSAWRRKARAGGE